MGDRRHRQCGLVPLLPRRILDNRSSPRESNHVPARDREADIIPGRRRRRTPYANIPTSLPASRVGPEISHGRLQIKGQAVNEIQKQIRAGRMHAMTFPFCAPSACDTMSFLRLSRTFRF